MSRQHYLPDGRYVLVPDSMSYEAADIRAAHDFPESFGIERKHGPWEAFQAGVGQGVGSGIQTLGQLTSSPRMEAYGAKLAAPGTEPGAYRPTSEEDISAAWQRGMIPGARAWLNQKALEPVAEAFGRYALPTAAAAAVSPLIPEAGAFGLGAAGARALLGGAAFTAADVPTSYQGNIQEQQAETAKAQAEGRSAPQFSMAANLMSALAQSAIVPVLGAFGQKAVAMMGPDLAAMTQRVLRGEITKEAAAATLNSTAKNIALQMGQAGVVGGVMMPATQALQMSQAGEDLSSPEAIARMKQAAITGLEFAPIGALAGFGRKGQERALDQAAAAGPERAAGLGTREQAAASEEAARIAQTQQDMLAGTPEVEAQARETARATQFAAAPPGTQTGLDIPVQPRYGAASTPARDIAMHQERIDQLQGQKEQLTVLRKAQVAADKGEDAKDTAAQVRQIDAQIKQAQANIETVTAMQAKALPAAPEAGPETFKPLFDSLGIPGGMRKLRAFEDHPLADDAARTEVKDQLTRLAEKTKTEGLATKIEAALNGPLFWEQQGLGMKLPTGEEMQASQMRAANAPEIAADAAAWNAGRGKIQDLWSGNMTAPKIEKPISELPRPIKTENQFNNRNEQMYSRWENAAKAGDHDKADAIVKQFSEETAPFFNEVRAQVNHPLPMDLPSGETFHAAAWDARMRAGRERARAAKQGEQNGPSNELPTATPEQGTDRAGNGEPVPGKGKPAATTVPGAVGRGVLPDDRSAVGKEPKLGALEPLGNALMQAAEVQKKLAATETRGTKQREIGPTGIGGAALPKTIGDLAPVTQKLKDAEPVTWWNDLAWMQRNRDTNPVARKGIEQGLAAKMFTRNQLEKRAIPIDDANRARQVNMQGAIRALEAGRTEAAKKSKRAATQTYERSRQAIKEHIQETVNQTPDALEAALAETRKKMGVTKKAPDVTYGEGHQGPTKADLAAIEAEPLDHRIVPSRTKIVLEQDGAEHEVDARTTLRDYNNIDAALDALTTCFLKT